MAWARSSTYCYSIAPDKPTLKCELLYRYSWPSRTDAELAIFDFIEVFYNRRRRHSTNDQVSPLVFEERYWSTVDLSKPQSVH